MNMDPREIAVFIIYLLFMLGIGVYFFFKEKDAGEKTYFLGGRQLGPWVAALSAGASDMSAWVLMGLPTSIYALGLGEVWISIGLALGYAISWLVEAPRLRRFSIVFGDAITVPQYLSNRFKAHFKLLQILCAIVFLIAYTIYSASSIKACGTLFNKVVGLDETVAMYLSGIIIVSYTFMGGFSAVCWTDFFQGLLVLGAMFLAPIFACFFLEPASATAAKIDPNFWNMNGNWKQIASGLGWGLGYFGMPHIIIRFMSIKSQKSLRKSAIIGISWTFFIVLFAAIIGILGREYLGYSSDIVARETVFVEMVRKIFPGIISGVLLSAVLAAAMSTADSQLLAASSAFTSDVYNPILRKKQACNQEMLWNGRLVVLIVALVAMLIATNPKSGSIMALVSNAWAVFGAAFGPAIMLSLFWKRFNILGATAGILFGAAVDIIWMRLDTGIYEIIPGFVAGFLIAVVVTLGTPAPSATVKELFDKAVNYQDAEEK